jgi:hypothetical protein
MALLLLKTIKPRTTGWTKRRARLHLPSQEILHLRHPAQVNVLNTVWIISSGLTVGTLKVSFC